MRDRQWYETKLKVVYDSFNDAVERKDLDDWELAWLTQELYSCLDIIELAVNYGVDMDSDILDRFKELECQLECYIWKRWR